jgi:hypothetical protein
LRIITPSLLNTKRLAAGGDGRCVDDPVCKAELITGLLTTIRRVMQVKRSPLRSPSSQQP